MSEFVTMLNIFLALGAVGQRVFISSKFLLAWIVEFVYFHPFVVDLIVLIVVSLSSKHFYF